MTNLSRNIHYIGVLIIIEFWKSNFVKVLIVNNTILLWDR